MKRFRKSFPVLLIVLTLCLGVFACDDEVDIGGGGGGGD